MVMMGQIDLIDVSCLLTVSEPCRNPMFLEVVKWEG